MRILSRVVNPIMNSFQNGNASQYYALKTEEEERENPYASSSTRYPRPAGTPKLIWFLAISSLLSLLGIGVLLNRGPSDTALSTVSPKSGSQGLASRLGMGNKDPQKHLIIAGYKAQNVKWMDRLKTDPTLAGWKVFYYVLDDPNPGEGKYTTPNSNGRESMAYLTYIIDNYDNIGDHVMMIHGHERAWHQPEPITMKIRNLNLTALDQHELFNIRCPDRPGCGGFEEPLNTVDTQPDRHEWAPLKDLWNEIFPHGDWMQDDGKLPSWLMNTCCGQFAVAKQAITRRSLEEWKRIREPLVKGSAAYTWGNNYNDYMLGLLYEKLWHLLFGKSAIFCHSADFCRDVQFGGKIKCDRWPEGGFPQLDADYKTVHCWDDVEDTEKMTF